MEAEAGDSPVPLEKLLEAFLSPVFEMMHTNARHFVPLMGRMYSAGRVCPIGVPRPSAIVGGSLLGPLLSDRFRVFRARKRLGAFSFWWAPWRMLWPRVQSYGRLRKGYAIPPTRKGSCGD